MSSLLRTCTYASMLSHTHPLTFTYVRDNVHPPGHQCSLMMFSHPTPSVCLPVCSAVSCLSVCSAVSCLSVCLSVQLFSVCLSVCLPVCASLHVFSSISYVSFPTQLSFTYSPVLWPWSGYLAVSLSVTKEAMTYSGEAKGHVLVTVSSQSVSKAEEQAQTYIRTYVVAPSFMQ